MAGQPGSGPQDEGKPPESNGFPEDSPRRCQAHLPHHPGTAAPTLGVPVGSPLARPDTEPRAPGQGNYICNGAGEREWREKERCLGRAVLHF